jgi:hypothetical protein
MAILQISKIQHRTGANTDLPQLDVGEIGFSTDEQRMYIGNDPILHPAANSGVTTQTEILTEHSDIAFSKIVGTANGVVNFSNVAPGQIVVARNVANTTNVEWVNGGGNSKQPGNVNLYANANIHLGHVDYVKLGGGTNGYILQTDGAGNLTWAAFLSGTVVSGTPGGANSQVQYNDGGTSFGGSAGFTYNKVTGELINSGNIVGGNINGPTFGAHNGTIGATTPNSGAFTSIVVSSNATVTGNVFAGNANITSRLNVTGNANVGNLFSTGTANVANLRVSSRVQSSLVPSSDQTYDLGTASLKWKDLYLSGTTLYLGNQTLRSNTNGVSISGNAYVANFVIANGFSATSLSGTLTTSAQPNITSLGTLANLNVNGVANLGAVSDLRISGGASGFVLTSNGAGGVSWLPGGSGGSGTPGGANTQIQFNDSSSFAGDANFTFTRTSSTLAVPNVSVSGVLNVSNVGNVRVPGGVTGQFLRTDGAGGLTWATPGGGGNPGGTNTQIQFNDGGNFAGNLNLLFFKTTQTLQVPNIEAEFTAAASSQPNITSVGNLVSLRVLGNTSTGNLTALNNVTSTLFIGSGASLTNINGANVSQVPNANFASYSTNATIANTANTVTVNAQPNITSVGQLTGVTVVGLTDLGSVGNVRITGGSANYLLRTDGAGNLTWVSAIAPDANANAVQFNNSGLFGGSSSFTFDSASNTLSVTSITTTLTAASNAQPNITSVGTLANLSVTGNITSGNANLGNAVTSNFFIGDGNNLSNIQGANVVGTVANANYAAYAGNVINSSQSNITSVGTLINLDVTGDANVIANVNANIVVANFIYGDGSNITSIDGAEVTGIVANANLASYAGYVVNPSQANITAVGNLTSLRVKTTSATNNNALVVEGSNTEVYISTSTSGIVSISDGASQTGSGLVIIDSLLNTVASRAVGFSAPKLSNPAISEVLVLAKNDSTIPNAHSIIPATNFTTNLGGTDEALGEVYFRQVSAGGINVKDTSGAPSAWPLAATWQLLAGFDGLYFTDGFSMFKVSAVDVTSDAGNGIVPTPLGPDPS